MSIMTDFKPGDRVLHSIVNTKGTVVDVDVENTPDCSVGQIPVLWDDDGEIASASPGNLAILNETPKLTKLFSEPSPFAPAPRPLVGPAPTPPAAPRYVAPFRATGTLVRDDTDSVVLEINFIGRDTRNVLEFATYVATALNASVFNED